MSLNVTHHTAPGSTVRVRIGHARSAGYPAGSLFELVMITDHGTAIVRTGHDSRDTIPMSAIEVVS